jgi:putative ABC transport system permease protein
VVGLIWVTGQLRRNIARSVGVAAGIAVAVGLLAAIGGFLSASRRTMTTRAAAQVAIDWQVEAQKGADPQAILDAVAHEPGVRAALPVEYFTTSGFQAVTAASTQTTGAGVVVGLDVRYLDAFPGVVRPLVGAPGGVLVPQQTAANLHVQPGDTIAVARPGSASVTVTVDAIVDLPQADSLFQIVGAPAGAQPNAPPDNVILLPLANWHAAFDTVALARPDLVHHQVHAALDRRLPDDPSAALTAVQNRARHFEASVAGAALVGDNLGAALDAARSDALYAQAIFIVLGTPGAALAGIVAASAAGSGAERRRREQALLRARGATTSRLVRLAALEAVAIGALGATAGIAGGRLLERTARPTPAWSGAAIASGVAIAAAALVLPAWRDARTSTVADARRLTPNPWWRRARVLTAVAALGGSAAVFAATSNKSFNLVLAPEGVPTVSVSYWAFLGPVLLWLGAGLLVRELAATFLARGRRVVSLAVRAMAGPLAPTVAAAMDRQRGRIGRLLTVVALTVAFAMSTATFAATFQHQSGVDAALTNGADVTVKATTDQGFGPQVASTLSAVQGVQAVEPLQHRFAYVGADLQDLFGVRPSSIVDAVHLQDSYFAGDTAHAIVARLAATPDGVLVSAETVKDFQLQFGDHLTLRLQRPSGGDPIPVTFQYIGVAKEFPTAPRDSFLVANADYVAAATDRTGTDTFLVTTSGAPPATVARAIRTRLGVDATVTDITSARAIVGSSLTAVDLTNLTNIELGFAVALIIASSGLALALGTAERRRTFAIVRALGANRRQLGAFIWTEAGYVSVGGILAGAVVGWALTRMLITVLTGVFDPSPERPVVPWGFLAIGLACAVLAVVVASIVAVRATHRSPLVAVRAL